MVIIYNISVSEGNKGSAFNWLILAVCPTPSSSNTLIATLKTRPEVSVILNVCLKAFSYHPELPGGSVQTTTLRKNPTQGGPWSQFHHYWVGVLTICSNHYLHTLQSSIHFLTVRLCVCLSVGSIRCGAKFCKWWGATHILVSLSILFEVGFPYLMSPYTFGSRSVVHCFRVTVTLTLTPGLSSRIIMYRAYLL